MLQNAKYTIVGCMVFACLMLACALFAAPAQAQPTDAGEVPETTADEAIAFVYVDETQVVAGQQLYFVVQVAQGEPAQEGSALAVTHTGTGQVLQAPCVAVQDDVLAFALALPMGTPAGTLEASGLSWRDGSAVREVAFPSGTCTCEVVSDAAVTVEGGAEAATQTSALFVGQDDQVVEADDVNAGLVQARGATPVDDSGKSVQHANGVLVVCIDPGHGGSEPGAIGHGMIEKNLNLKIAQSLKAELDTYQNVQTVMTRTGDAYVGLQERVNIASRAGADVFVSVHCNAVDTIGGGGFEVWVPNDSSYRAANRDRARQIARNILAELEELGRKNRGVRTRSSDASAGVYSDGYPTDYYAVIRGSRYAGITGLLVEHLFMDQAGDAAVLANDNNLRRMGVDDATGIARTYGLQKKRVLSGKWVRKQGDDAIGTMQQIVATGFGDNTCKTAVLATMDGYWDALTASALAGVNKCPVLMTPTKSLHQTTRSELQRLGVKKVYIAGGTKAVSSSVEKAVKDMGIEVERLSDTDAAGTARSIFLHGKASGSWGSTAIVATVDGYWDALAASPYAYSKRSPVFLASEQAAGNAYKLDTKTLSVMLSGYFDRIVVCGGPAAVSADVEDQLRAAGFRGTLVRLDGPTAGGTSAKIATFCLQEGMVANRMAVATMDGYWDALSGATLCGKLGTPLILLSEADYSGVDGFIVANKAAIQRGYIFGGPMAVTQKSEYRIDEALD